MTNQPYPDIENHSQDTAALRSTRTAIVLSLLFGVGFGLMALSYTIGNPLFHANDELWQYYRAVGISTGKIIGEETTFEKPGYPEAKLAQVNRLVRAVEVPENLTPQGGVGCTAFSPELPATCTDNIVSIPEATVRPTILGVYPPEPYIAPAAAMLIADDAKSALFYARAANALVSSLFVAAAALMVFYRSEIGTTWLTVALMLVVTPMFVFVMGTLSGSGLEFASGTVFALALMRILRDREQSAVIVSVAAGAAVVFLLSRSSAPLWFATILVVSLFAYGSRSMVRPLRRAFSWLAIVSIFGLVGNRLWEVIYGPELIITVDGIGPAIVHSAARLGEIVNQAIGVLGWLDTRMPASTYMVWILLSVTLVAWAFLVGSSRQRAAVLVALATAIVGPPVLDALLIRGTGFGVQGRHVFLILVLPIILAGMVIDRAPRERVQLSGRTTLWVIGGTALMIHVVAFLSNARRHAVGSEGPIVFFGHSQWTPPGGWGVSLLIFLLGLGTVGCALVLIGREQVLARRRPPAIATQPEMSDS